MNSHMRKFFVSLLLFLVLGSLEVSAQLNKNYFSGWAGAISSTINFGMQSKR